MDLIIGKKNEYLKDWDTQTDDLPNKYISIDEIRKNISMNNCMQLYGRKINNEYHYFVSERSAKFYSPTFLDDVKIIHVVTKCDFSKFEEHEKIYDNMYLTSYLIKNKNKNNNGYNNEIETVPISVPEDNNIENSDIKNAITYKQKKITNWDLLNMLEKKFWKKFPSCNFLKKNENMYGSITNLDDIPSEYIPVDIFIFDNDKNMKKYTLYCKKVQNKYYYLLDLTDINIKYSSEYVYYYQPEFNNLLSHFTNVTKEDFTKYTIDDCILGNMHSYDWMNNQLMIKINKERQNKQDFWEKHNYSKFQKTHLMEDLPTEYTYICDVYLMNDDNNCYDFFGKKDNENYYYLIGNKRIYNVFSTTCDDCYNLDHDEFLKKTTDVSKDDLSKYDKNDEITGGYHFISYINKLKLGLM